MYQLVYSSTATPPMTESDVDAILVTARQKNQQLEVTGFLLFDGNRFLQLLEGEEETVKNLYGRIACDKRHNSIEALVQDESPTRIFSNWSMAYQLIDEGGIARFGGSLRRESVRELTNCLKSRDSFIAETIRNYMIGLIANVAAVG